MECSYSQIRHVFHEFDNAVEAFTKCDLCKNPHKLPQATLCGKIYCLHCLHVYISEKEMCPNCESTHPTDGHIFANQFLSNFVKQMHCMREVLKKTKDTIDQADISYETHKFSNLKENVAPENKVLVTLLQTMILKSYEDIRKIKSNIKIYLHDLEYISLSVPFRPDYTSRFESPNKISINEDTVKSLSNISYDYFKANNSSTENVMEHLAELQLLYWNVKTKCTYPKSEYLDHNYAMNSYHESFKSFNSILCGLTRYRDLTGIARLWYRTDTQKRCGAWTVDLDKDDELIAIGGSENKIKIYSYHHVVNSQFGQNCCISELKTEFAVSLVSWSPLIKTTVASCHTTGNVILWDCSVATKTRMIPAHTKRVWGLTWNKVNSNIFATSSEDGYINFWSQSDPKKVFRLTTEGCICGVEFAPNDINQLSFGSSNACLYTYDLRNPKQPLRTYQSHRKPITSVRYTCNYELVSASLDGNIILWSEDDQASVKRVYKGHVVNKAAVGLDIQSDFIACGSENNTIYVYNKALSNPFFKKTLESEQTILSEPIVSEHGSIFSLKWRKTEPVLICCNDRGSINVLSLI